MKTLIHSLFEYFEFEEKKLEFGSLYTHSSQPYWLLVEENDPLKILENQVEFFQACEKSIGNSDFKKNASMLIIFKSQNPSSFKDHILRIEENPYHFKKHVLVYSDTALASLNENTDGGKADVFIQKLSDQQVFNTYKKEFKPQDWRRLLYNIAFKLPFVKISITEEEELSNLYKSSNDTLDLLGLLELKQNIDSTFSETKIDKLGVDDFLHLISKINGDKN